MSSDLVKDSLIYHNESARVFVYRGTMQNTIPVVIKEQEGATIFEANLAISEALAMSAIKHPAICTVYRCFLETMDDKLKSVIVVEQLDRDLMQEIDQRKEANQFWSELELLRMLALLASALYTAQQKGISHRDIKPQNIFISGDYVKIGDFGSSVLNLTVDPMRSTVTGSPFFFSPELKRKYSSMLAGQDDSQYDPYKSDVYSLGVTIVFMAMLRQPEELKDVQRLEIVTEECISRLTCYPNLQPFLRDMLKIDPQQRISFEQLDSNLSNYFAPPETIMQETQDEQIELVVCSQCGNPVTDVSWMDNQQAPSRSDANFCSLDCYKSSLTPVQHCVGCGFICGGDSISLSCGDYYHSKQCLFEMLRDKSQRFAIGVRYVCPKCAKEITQQTIYSIFGEQRYDEMVASEYKSKCIVCHKNPIYITFKKCEHQICSGCERTFFGKSVCPLCSRLAKIVSMGSSSKT